MSTLQLLDTTVITKPNGGMKESVKTNSKKAAAIRSADAAVVMPDNFHVVRHKSQLEEIARLIADNGRFVYDLETSGTYAWKDKVYACGIYVGGQAFAIPFEHVLQPVIDVNDFRCTLGKFFSDPDIARMNHFVAFDSHFIEEQLGIPVGQLYCCTLLQAWIVDPNTDHGLKELCAYYGIDSGGQNYSAQFGNIAWSHLPPKLANYYLCKDVALVPKLYDKQNEILETKPKLKRLFWDIEMPVLNIAYGMEREGIRVDEDYFYNVLTPDIYRQHAEATKAIAPWIEPHLALTATDNNPPMTVEETLASPKALTKVFFDGIGTPLVKYLTLKMDTNPRSPTFKQWVKRSLDKEAIAGLKHEREEIRLLGEWRQVDTVKKLIIDTLPELLVNGRVHPTIYTTGTKTGRMSMSKPNPQQAPSRMGPAVRNSFIPDPGNVFISFDFSQQEMRILAHFSGDPGLNAIFVESKYDMYSQMAIDVFGLDPAEFDDPQKAKKHPARDKTKITVLGTGYGMGVSKLSRSLGVSKDEAQEILDLYFGRYSGILKYKERAINFARKHGYIVTLLGRERPTPNINAPEEGLRLSEERKVINTPIQGTAADQCKLAARNCYQLIQDNGWPVRIVLLIHDEIIFEADKEWVCSNPDAIKQIKAEMEGALMLSVPVVCNYVVEERWGTEFDIDKVWDDLSEAA